MSFVDTDLLDKKNVEETKNSYTRNFGLDLARALAISLVVFSHLSKSVEVFGLYGVELFFALSGFLIGGILYRIFR